MKVFQGKLALVIGGSSGIGLAVSKMLANLGANVWILARRETLLQSALEEIKKLAIQPAQSFGYLVADISSWELVQKVLGDFSTNVGTPDLLVNSAGISRPGEFIDLDTEIFHQLMDVNYMGTVHAIKSVLPGMVTRKSGYIVNISSIAGLGGVYGYSAYGATKYAIHGLTDVLMYELKPTNIKFSIVFPPDTQTPGLEADQAFLPPVTVQMNADFGGMMTADEVAKAIINGIMKEKYFIIPGFSNKLLNFANNLFGYRLVGLLVDFSRNKLARKTAEVK
jgi:3-dehydrosphinganine reductase